MNERATDTRRISNGGRYERPTSAEIAETVISIRKHLELKQLVLADEAGVTERTIQRVEEGRTVGDDTLRKVARALRLREDAFTVPLLSSILRGAARGYR